MKPGTGLFSAEVKRRVFFVQCPGGVIVEMRKHGWESPSFWGVQWRNLSEKRHCQTKRTAIVTISSKEVKQWNIVKDCIGATTRNNGTIETSIISISRKESSNPLLELWTVSLEISMVSLVFKLHHIHVFCFAVFQINRELQLSFTPLKKKGSCLKKTHVFRCIRF